MEVARRVGAEAGHDRQQRVHAALIRVTIDAAQARQPQDGLAPAAPNLVWDLGGAIADAMGERPATLPAVRDRDRARLLAEAPGPVEISVDGVAGAVRGQFAGMPPLHVTGDGATIVTGALVMAVAVADDPDAAELGGSEVVDPSNVEIRPPWEVSHPILLSPAAWLLATAYHLA
jgi:hypothetical protein